MDKFKIEKQYQLYLQRMGLKESKMPLEQKKQLRQTFFIAWGQLLRLLREDIAELSDEEGARVLQDLENQFAAFAINMTRMN